LLRREVIDTFRKLKKRYLQEKVTRKGFPVVRGFEVFRASGVVVGRKVLQQRSLFAPVGRKKGAGPKAGRKQPKKVKYGNSANEKKERGKTPQKAQKRDTSYRPV
jgi:hypothetical protein